MSDDSLLKIPDNVLGEVYRDAFSPSAKSFGIALNHIVSILKLVTLPVGVLGPAADVLYQKYQDFLTESFKKVPEDKRRPPDLNVAAPITQNVMNVFDKNDLKALYSNLLASASNTDACQLVHPAFAAIISQIDSTDVAIIDILRRSSLIRYVFVILSSKGTDLIHFPSSFSHIVECENDHVDVDSSIINLERLGLIRKISGIENYTEYLYEEICSSNLFKDNHKLIKQLKLENAKQTILSIRAQEVNFIASPLGERFIESCT